MNSEKKYKYKPQMVIDRATGQILYDYTYVKDKKGNSVFGCELNGKEKEDYFKEVE